MSKRLDHIDQMRGLAAFAVVGFHSLSTREAASFNGVLAVAHAVFINGWLGVHVFFAISGWCIAQRVANAQARREPCLRFIADRAFRIYPVYWAALALTLAILAASSRFNGVPLSRNVPHGVVPWFAELLLVQPALGYGAVVLVSWSLFYELSFYGASAAALGLRRLSIPSEALLFVGGVGSLAVAWHAPTGWLTGFSLWPNFFVGMLAWWHVSRRAGAIWLASLAMTLIAIWGEPSAAGWVAAGTALLLGIAGRRTPRIPRLVGRGLTAFGTASYSIYLAHLAILSPFFNLANRFVSPRSYAYVAVWILGMALAVAAGLVLHMAVEVPCEKWRHRTFSARRGAGAQGA